MSRSPWTSAVLLARRLRLPVLAALVAVMATGIALLAVEGALRLFGYGHPGGFTVSCSVRGRPAWCDNDRFTWQFFPPGAFRLPAAFAIPAEKRAGTFRIFVVGESAAAGDPEPSYSFSRYLEMMLSDRFPGASFEVINTGIAAINSHALLPITRDLARRDGDLFILYLGNNEVVGSYGAGATRASWGESLPLVRARIFLNTTRLGQLLGAGARAASGEQRSWTGMSMFLDQRVPAGAPALTRVRNHFRRNLRGIVAAARSSGARVIISTVAVNLKDSAPFASAHREGLSGKDSVRWEILVAEGDTLERQGRPDAALERYRAAAAVDDRHAELQFRLARAEWAAGRFEEAKARFAAARELDALRFRADSSTNSIIREVTARAGPGVELVDAESLLAAASPHGVPGRELFYEHVHLRPRGNYLVAGALFPRVAALLPERVRGSASLALPSQADVERRLALTAFDRRRLARLVTAWLAQPPFTAQLTHEAEAAALRQEASEGRGDPLATAAAYRAAIALAPDDRWLQVNYGGFLEAYGELAAAEVVYRRALEVLPGNYAASDRLARVLARMGKHAEAIAVCRRLLQRMPYHPTAYLTMAYALAGSGAYDESVAAYERAVSLHPPYSAEGYAGIGLARLKQERYEAAAEAFRLALEQEPAGPRREELRRRLAAAEARGQEPGAGAPGR